MVASAASIEAYQQRLIATWGAAAAPLSTVLPREFAESIMQMPDAHGSTRPFSFAFAPYQLEPYLELFNARNQEVDMMMASRLGKSRIVLTALGFIIVEQPCRIGVMWPVEGDGKLWSKDDFMGELVEPTPKIAALIENALGQRNARNTLLHKKFPGGSMQIMGANAPGRMRRMKARVLYADEIDAIVEITTDEGDQLKIFAKRGSEFPDCIQVYCSYPSLKGKSRIESKLLASDLRQWFVTCPVCGGEPFIMHRTGVGCFDDKFKRSRLVYDKDHPELARLECPNKGCQLDDRQRHAAMMGGDPANPRYDLWRPTRPFTGRAGFHANALLWPHPVDPIKYPGGYLEILARKEIEIEQSENPERSRRVLINTDDAETYQAAGDVKPEHTALFLRREDYDPSDKLPAGVLAIEAFVDVQLDRLEVFVQGFGLNKQVWDLDYVIIKGGKGAPLAKPDEGVWAELDKFLLTTTYAHPCGRNLRIRVTLVDCGNWRDNVFAFTRPRVRRKVYASRGDTELSRPILEKRCRKEGKSKTRVWVIGTHAAKEIVYQRLEQTDPRSTGYRHYPKLGKFSEQYFKMLTAENSEDRHGRDGQWHKWFGCEKGVRNEALDGAVGCMAAEKIDRPNYKELSEELAIREDDQPPSKPKPGKPSQPPKENFATKGTRRPGGSLLRRPGAKPGSAAAKTHIRKVR